MSPLETSTASRPLQRTLSSHTTHSLPCREGDTPLNLAINRKKSDVVAYLQRIGARGQPNGPEDEDDAREASPPPSDDD